MGISSELNARAEDKCELCQSTSELFEYLVPPKNTANVENQVALCNTCIQQIDESEPLDENHWRCLNESIWNPEPSVQVLAFRMLTKLNQKDWATELLNTMYLEESTKEWAEQESTGSLLVHKDSLGNILKAGDTVILTQDLKVKGGGFTAKRGTPIRKIRLVINNEDHIEAKVEGQDIVILTKFVKKS